MGELGLWARAIELGYVLLSFLSFTSLLLSLPSLTPFLLLQKHITLIRLSFNPPTVSCRIRSICSADIQLYTTAISARPSSQLVALCDLNSERMKHHNDLLKELGKPEAKTYHAVCPFSLSPLSSLVPWYLPLPLPLPVPINLSLPRHSSILLPSSLSFTYIPLFCDRWLAQIPLWPS